MLSVNFGATELALDGDSDRFSDINVWCKQASTQSFCYL